MGNVSKLVSLIVLEGYEVDGSASGVQENLRNRLGPLIEIQVTGYAYECLFVSNIWISFWLRSHSYPKIIVEAPF